MIEHENGEAGSGPSAARGPERRARRTEDPLVALAYLLEATRRRGGLDAIVLSDGQGLPIVGAGGSRRCESLAGLNRLEETPANDTVPSRLDVLTRTAAVRRLAIDGIQVFLLSEGGGPDAEAEVGRAAEGAIRILGGPRTQG